jgi:DNA-binding CsgD family transcriptional regulator
MLDTVRTLLAAFTPLQSAVARALAVLGDAAPPQAIASVAGVGVGDLGPAVEAMAAAGLLDGAAERFAHELVASAITETLSAAELERLHRAAASALMSLREPDETIAAHLLRCRPQGDSDVSAVLRRAAQQAAERGAPGVAVTYLERALSERAPHDDRGRMLAALATDAFHAGLPDARRRLRDALLESRDLSGRLDVLTRLAAVGVVRGDDPGLSHLLERIALDADEESRLAVETAALDALLTLPSRNAERARRAAAIELTDATDPLLRRVVLAHRAWLATEGGAPDADAAAALALEAIDDGSLLREAGQRSAYHLCVRALIVTDHADDARLAIADLAAEATARGSRRLQAIATWYEAELALRTGRVTDAQRLATEALALADDEIRACVAGAVAVLVSALTERGAFAQAHAVLREHRLDGRIGGGCPSETGVLLARARLALAEGDFERAHAEACEAGCDCASHCRPNPTWSGWRSTAALALAHLGRRADAARLADTELELAQHFGTPLPVARALHARAVAEPDDCRRIALCKRALALLEGRPATLESTRLRLELGSTLARIGRRVEARDALRPALADADAAGATLLAARARRELVATGLRPRRAAVEGAEALTPRQRQITELAAAGKGNRAIAQQLFLSIKTVETHLAAAYRKLGVSVRAELGPALAG